MVTKLKEILVGLGVLLLGLSAVIYVAKDLKILPIEDKGYWAGWTEGIKDGERNAKGKKGFTLIQLGDARRDQFLLNRGTGQIWENVCSFDNDVTPKRTNDPYHCPGVNAWSPVPVLGISPADSPEMREYIQYWEDVEKRKNAR